MMWIVVTLRKFTKGLVSRAHELDMWIMGLEVRAGIYDAAVRDKTCWPYSESLKAAFERRAAFLSEMG